MEEFNDNLLLVAFYDLSNINNKNYEFYFRYQNGFVNGSRAIDTSIDFGDICKGCGSKANHR